MLSKLASHLAPASPTAPTPAAAAAAAAGPLDGITVIDAGQAITGPLAASMLGDMGAEVIKVESPHGMGDLNRPVGPMRGGEGIYMHNFVRRLQAVAHPSPALTHPEAAPCAQNRGKKGVVLDLKLPSAAATLKKLAASADVFIQNMRPGAFERMGLSYEDLRKLNPNLICARPAALLPGPAPR